MNISIITFVILATGVLSVIMIWISSYWSAKNEIMRATIFLIAAIGIFIISHTSQPETALNPL